MNFIISDLSVIIISTAILCFIAEIAKQPLILAYIFAGLIAGPMGLNLIQGSEFFQSLAQVGVVLLLYLIGLQLKPQKFAETIKKSYRISLISVAAIVPIICLIGWATGLSNHQIIVLSVASIFSSTVVVLKTLQDERGSDEDVQETCLGILLIQDVIAILSLLVISSLQKGGLDIQSTLNFLATGIVFIAGVFIAQKYLLRNILKIIIDRTDLVFLIGLAWCFSVAEIAELLHLSREIGGFMAGLSLTALPAQKQRIFVSKSATIRDFFMILFFFVLGANLEFQAFRDYSKLILLMLPAILIVKPTIFYLASRYTKHNQSDSREIGLRLGQNSEFSAILAASAVAAGYIAYDFAMAIQIILFMSIIFSNLMVKYIPLAKR